MGTSVVTNAEKGLAVGRALAPSQALEALPNAEEGQKASAMSEAASPTRRGEGGCAQIEVKKLRKISTTFRLRSSS